MVIPEVWLHATQSRTLHSSQHLHIKDERRSRRDNSHIPIPIAQVGRYNKHGLRAYGELGYAFVPAFYDLPLPQYKVKGLPSFVRTVKLAPIRQEAMIMHDYSLPSLW
jgi:hypothetical protein